MAVGAAAVVATAKAAEESSIVAAKRRAKRAVTKVDSNIHLPLARLIASEKKNKRNQSSNLNIKTIKQLKTLTVMITHQEDLT